MIDLGNCFLWRILEDALEVCIAKITAITSHTHTHIVFRTTWWWTSSLIEKIYICMNNVLLHSVSNEMEYEYKSEYEYENHWKSIITQLFFVDYLYTGTIWQQLPNSTLPFRRSFFVWHVHDFRTLVQMMSSLSCAFKVSKTLCTWSPPRKFRGCRWWRDLLEIGLKSEKRMTWILGTSSILENRVELVTVSCWG